MARIARIVVPGLPHHIVQRGNRRQQVFFSDDDRREPLLDDNFVASEIKDWKAFLSEEDKQMDVIYLKQHVNTGRPLGDSQFIETIEKLTGRILDKQKPGPKARG
ncbi:MAG TPA: hypothetical protein VI976_02410 [Candidatus Omnitrophota bacterium]|nr:hypothetical protein [Candidatus Omnitrophota bacterium]